MHVTLRYVAVFAAVLSVPALRPAEAQDTKVRSGSEAEIRKVPGGFSLYVGGENRAVLGVTLGGGGKFDTLGVLIDDVRSDGPAGKAGLKEGDRVTAINGVNLKVAAVDADDPELQGLGQRRLTRELGKIKPGDEVELHVATGGQQRTLRVKTVSAAELNRTETRGTLSAFRTELDKQAALGLSIGSAGNTRDTLGLFISSVVNDGPADKAGVVEGERIASINGVDVRLPKEDAGDGQAASARVNRFMREVRKMAPGDKAALRVYSAGRYRDVTVTAGKASELSSGFRINVGDGAMVWSSPRVPFGGTITMPARPPQLFRFDSQEQLKLDGSTNYEAFQKAMQEMRSKLENARTRLNDGRIEVLKDGGFRIRTVTPSMIQPVKPVRTVVRKVITTV